MVGNNDAFGEGDFWLVDDDWGDGQQKICIFNPLALTKNFALEMQKLLVEKGVDTEIFVQLEIAGVPPQGLVISGSGIQEHWHLEEVKKVLGADFYM